MGRIAFRGPFLGWCSRTQVANAPRQASFMVLISIEYSTSRYGGGTHQWNVSYQDVQHIRRVSPHNLVCLTHLLSHFLSQTLVHPLRRPNLQPGLVFHKTLHHAADSPNLLLRTARRMLLAYPVSHRGEWNLLHHLFFRPDLPILSTQQDLESRSIWALSKLQPPLSCLSDFQHDLGHSDAERTRLSDLEPADVVTAKDGSLCYFPNRPAVSLSSTSEYASSGLTSLRACIASMIRLIYLVFLIRTKDYTYSIVPPTLWACVTLPNSSLIVH